MRLRNLFFVVLLALSANLFAADLSWEGAWTSSKPKDKGEVTCTLKQKSKKWTAYFEGENNGNELSFKVPCVLTKKGDSFDFEGETKVGPDRYELSGNFSEKVFQATFKSKGGNTGTISLKRSGKH